MVELEKGFEYSDKDGLQKKDKLFRICEPGKVTMKGKWEEVQRNESIPEKT